MVGCIQDTTAVFSEVEPLLGVNGWMSERVDRFVQLKPAVTRNSRLPSRQKDVASSAPGLSWPAETELVGLTFDLEALAAGPLPAQYTVGLHAWFLQQVRQHDPAFSAYLHDGESEKPFTISGLEGLLLPRGNGLQLQVGRRYCWSIAALSQPVVQWLHQWLQCLPDRVGLHQVPLKIQQVKISQPPTTYAQLVAATSAQNSTVALSFVTPTSFRRKSYHLPLPYPKNVFHSYLRRWNNFSNDSVDQKDFLDWIDDFVIIYRHRLESVKVAAGKYGSVTGFTGAVEFGLSSKALPDTEYVELFYALMHLAPYCGTGHKTTFGLGQTRVGWLLSEEVATLSPIQTVLAQRIAELTEVFLAQRKRSGGERAQKAAETWATILARRELGESLQEIAQDLEMEYATAKSYVKLARRALRMLEGEG